MTTLNRLTVSLPVISANGNARRAPTPSLVAELDAVVVRGSYGKISTVYHVILVEPVSGRIVWRSTQHAVGAESAAKFAAKVTAALATGADPSTSAKWAAVARPVRGIDRELAARADAE